MDVIRNAKIGYIFQNYNLLDNRTVFENVAIALRMVGMKDREQVKERVNYCLEAVGIYPYRNKMADALSGGQRQRVAIARAIAKNPKIIIADEPTGNLDSATGALVMETFHRLQERGKTIVLITHDAKIAAQTPRAIHIHDGRVLEPADENEVVI